MSTSPSSTTTTTKPLSPKQVGVGLGQQVHPGKKKQKDSTPSTMVRTNTSHVLCPYV